MLSAYWLFILPSPNTALPFVQLFLALPNKALSHVSTYITPIFTECVLLLRRRVVTVIRLLQREMQILNWYEINNLTSPLQIGQRHFLISQMWSVSGIRIFFSCVAIKPLGNLLCIHVTLCIQIAPIKNCIVYKVNAGCSVFRVRFHLLIIDHC